MNGKVDYLPTKLLLRRYYAKYGASIAAGASKRMLPSAVGYTIPEGYYPIGITYFTTGSQYLSLDYLQLYANSDQSSSYWISVKNTGSSSSGTTSKATVDVLFAPRWMVAIYGASEPIDISGQPDSDIIKEPVFIVKNYNCAYTSLSSGGAKAFSQSNMGFSIPDGYEIFSLRNISAGNMNVTVSDCDPFNSSRMVTVRNTHSSAISGTAALGVTFINKKYLEYGLRRNLSITAQEGITVNCSESNGTALVGNKVIVAIDNPQTLLYIMSIEGLSVSTIRLSSDNSYSYQFTMPDRDVSLNIIECRSLIVNISPSSAVGNAVYSASPTRGQQSSTPSGPVYYCDVGSTVKFSVAKNGASVVYAIQSATLSVSSGEETLTVNETDTSSWVELVMPSSNAYLNITLKITTT